MPKLYSYVVYHDHGFAPCPFGGFCTLAKCKYGTSKRNIVEMAEEGDWIAGTSGVKDELDFSEEFVEDFVRWLENNFKVGVHGPPCDPHSDLDMPTCPPKVRRKGHY